MALFNNMRSMPGVNETGNWSRIYGQQCDLLIDGVDAVAWRDFQNYGELVSGADGLVDRASAVLERAAAPDDAHELVAITCKPSLMTMGLCWWVLCCCLARFPKLRGVGEQCI